MKKLRSALTTLSLLLSYASVANAQITNPATGVYGNSTPEAQSGQLFVSYFVIIWNTLITVGSIIVLIYFLIGAFEWITSAGDNAKLQTARNRMMHAFIGLLLLVTSYTIIGFISRILFGEQFNILRPEFFGVSF